MCLLLLPDRRIPAEVEIAQIVPPHDADAVPLKTVLLAAEHDGLVSEINDYGIFGITILRRLVDEVIFLYSSNSWGDCASALRLISRRPSDTDIPNGKAPSESVRSTCGKGVLGSFPKGAPGAGSASRVVSRLSTSVRLAHSLRSASCAAGSLFHTGSSPWNRSANPPPRR